MNIGGPGVLEVDAMPIFLIIAGTYIMFFLKSLVTRLTFLENPQQPNQGFWKIRSRSREHF